jgi:MFS transporter, DHA2 family, multidrug resistance protein
MKPDATRALAAALPADLSHSPVLGILVVNMGAGIATLAGRFLSLGLADLKGHLGIGVDEGAWIGTAFNAATMFIGPLTVYLGALLGTRPVLLVCASVFAVVSACLPFAHSYGVLILLMVIAGLSSGTFYPLTLSFALRNIPLRYLAVTLGLYATCIEGAVNFAPSLYGVYRDHLSWEWMFWTSALAAPVMAACVYYGIPASPRPRPSGTAPSFAGFLYASAGLALLFAALDQGQRLDWWRSSVFTALFTTGSFFLLCAAIRRLSRPNPLVDLPFLRKWNTLALGFGIFAFRFCLLATALVIPQTLAVHGFDAGQIGPAVLWTAFPELCLAFFAAHLLNKGLDARLLMASGFAVMGGVCLLNANVTSAWAAENYFRIELLMAVGQSFAFVGLVSSIILQSFFSGALRSPSRVLTFSAFFHCVRIFAGQIGVTLMLRFIAEQEKVYSHLIGLHVQLGDWSTEHAVRLLTAGLAAKSSDAAAAAGRAVGVIAGDVRVQAYTLALSDAFHLMAWMSVAMLIVLATLRRFPLNFRELAGRSSAPPRRPVMMVRASIFALVLFVVTGAASAQQPEPAAARPITLREAVDLALARNHAVRLAQLSVDEKDRAKEVAKSGYFPRVRNETTLVHLTDTQLVEIPAGGLGVVGATPVPPQSLILNQGGLSAATNGTGIVQPLTQLFRVRAANDVARAEAGATREKARGVEDETVLRVHQIYYRILIADISRRAVLAKIQASEDLQRERIQQVRYGSALEADLIESRAQALQARQELLTTELQRSDLQMQLDPNVAMPSERCERETCLHEALDSHPEIAEARMQVEMATSAVRLAKSELVPDVEAFARYSFQNNVPFLAGRFGTVGIRASYDLFDGGRKRAVLRQRETELAQAKENLARVSDDIELRVQTAYNKIERTSQMIRVSEELVALRGESRRVAAALLVNGGALVSQAKQSAAQELEAQAALLQSQLDYVQAADEMDAAIGRRPR